MKKNMCLFLTLFFCASVQYSYAAKAKEIVFYNWKDYTDQSILDDFEKQFGVKVILREYETKDMMFSEIQSEPGAFDVINGSDIVPLLAQTKLLLELDLIKIPNRRFIKKDFMNTPIDPENKYSLAAYLWGAVGLAINTNFVPADVDSWAILWDKRYKGKIALMDDYREAMAAVLKYSHFSVNTTDPKELEAAKKNAELLRDNEVQFGETIANVERVARGELWIAQVYNGDVFTSTEDAKDVKFIFPKEGFPLSVDNLAISIDSKNKEAAYQLVNFFLEPKNAARAAVMFVYPPSVEAEAFMDKAILDNPTIYPPQDILRNKEFFINVGKAENEYTEIFNVLKQTKAE